MIYLLLKIHNQGAMKCARILNTMIPYLKKNNVEYRFFKTKAAGKEVALSERSIV